MVIYGKLLRNESRYITGESGREPGPKGDVSERLQNAVDTVKLNMNRTKKNLILFVIIVILVSGIPAITMCTSNCASSDLDFDSPVNGNCSFSLHSFVQIVVVISAFLALVFAGRFLLRDRQLIPAGVYWPLFRPPRFSH